MMSSDDVTIRVSVEWPRGEYDEDFYVDRAKWDAMTEDEREKYVDTQCYPVALSNAGIGGSYKVVDEEEVTD
jgi:hypothetical protein